MSIVVDLLSIASVVGVWPRYIEPRLLKTSYIDWKLTEAHSHLKGLKIVHLSDLHFHKKVSQKFLDKVSRKVRDEKPDLILFTGDFICYSILEQPERLKSFLDTLQAPLGSFCSFGNHDYSAYVSLSSSGYYEKIEPLNPLIGVFRGIKTLISPAVRGYKISEFAKQIPHHGALCALLKTTPFRLLDNETITLPLGLNLTGLGDLALGRCQPEKAFEGYSKQFPGIILSHNPDTFPLLDKSPGDWILSGHTHGEQIHFPYPKLARKLSQKLARLENSAYTRGVFTVGNKKLYVNRGLGCHKPFRLFSPPEMSVICATYEEP